MLTNIQTPYNAEFYAELERKSPLRVYYGSVPSRLGRAWQLPRRHWEYVGATWTREAMAIWGRRQSDVILSGDYLSGRSIMRLSLARASRRRFFWGERLSPGGTGKRLGRRALLGGLDAVFAVGTWARAGYRDVLGTGTPIHVLPYVCAAHETPRKPNEFPVVGFVGSLVERKGVDILVSALARMKDPPLLEVVGSGPLERSLRRLAAELKVRVKWHGELSLEATNQVRAAWWLQAVPSRYDGWAVVVNEALASGVPVLASDTTGAAHDLLDGKCGEMVSADDDWATSIENWMTSAASDAATTAAREVAESVGARRASTWLLDVLTSGDARERDFVTEALGPKSRRGGSLRFERSAR